MPTLSRKRRRSSISRRISRAMWRSVSVSSTSAEPLQRALHAQRGELVDRHARRRAPRATRAAAARPCTPGTARSDMNSSIFSREQLGVGLAVAALEVRDDALEARRVRAPAAVAVAVGDLDAVAVGAVEEEVALVLVELLPRRLEVDAVLLGDRLGDLLVVLRRASSPTAPARPRRSTATGRARRARGRSPSASPGRCSAGTRRAAS